MMFTVGMVKRLTQSVATNYETKYGMKAYYICIVMTNYIIKPLDLETI
jgi:hypothetical protein